MIRLPAQVVLLRNELSNRLVDLGVVHEIRPPWVGNTSVPGFCALPSPCRCEVGTRPRHAHGGGQRVEVERAAVADAVDEEGRRTRDVAEIRTLDVGGHPRGAYSLTQVLGESVRVEAELFGMADQILRRQGVLTSEQQVMHG